jgi:NAD(P)-dependent dehydrogenase (short-subunit alcohol dehydrogenase family)
VVNDHSPGAAGLPAERTEPMDRTYVITGAASGIGAATARYCRGRGGRVIACDLHGADVVADLTTVEGRAALVDGVTRLSEDRIDAIVANAGGGPPETASRSTSLAPSLRSRSCGHS